jgi:hypothetical protein
VRFRHDRLCAGPKPVMKTLIPLPRTVFSASAAGNTVTGPWLGHGVPRPRRRPPERNRPTRLRVTVAGTAGLPVTGGVIRCSNPGHRRTAPRSEGTTRSTNTQMPPQVAVGVDESEGSRSALVHAVEAAVRRHARLRVVTAFESAGLSSVPPG